MNTITPSDKFSFARFAAVLTSHLTGNCRSMFAGLGIGYAAYLFGCCMSALSKNGQVVDFGYMAETFKSNFPIVFFLMSMVVPSLATNDCARKERRISTMMLPALKSEKFWARIAAVAICGPLFAVVVHFVLYTLTFVLSLAFSPAATPGTFMPFEMSEFHLMSFSDVRSLLAQLPESITRYLLVVSTFTLGGFVWRKHGFVLTVVCLVAFGLVVAGIAEINADEIERIGEIQLSGSLRTLIQACFTTLFVWLAYRRFTKMQAVERKWRLLPGFMRRNNKG